MGCKREVAFSAQSAGRSKSLQAFHGSRLAEIRAPLGIQSWAKSIVNRPPEETASAIKSGGTRKARIEIAFPDIDEHARFQRRLGEHNGFCSFDRCDKACGVYALRSCELHELGAAQRRQSEDFQVCRIRLRVCKARFEGIRIARPRTILAVRLRRVFIFLAQPNQEVLQFWPVGLVLPFAPARGQDEGCAVPGFSNGTLEGGQRLIKDDAVLTAGQSRFIEGIEEEVSVGLVALPLAKLLERFRIAFLT